MFILGIIILNDGFTIKSYKYLILDVVPYSLFTLPT